MGNRVGKQAEKCSPFRDKDDMESTPTGKDYGKLDFDSPVDDDDIESQPLHSKQNNSSSSGPPRASQRSRTVNSGGSGHVGM